MVTYGEAFAVQPFSNIMQTITLTGAQLDAVLEQQWQPRPNGTTTVRILQISSTLHYSWTSVSADRLDRSPTSRSTGCRSTRRRLPGLGEQLPRAGGDGFTVFAQGTDHRWADRPGRLHRLPDRAPEPRPARRDSDQDHLAGRVPAWAVRRGHDSAEPPTVMFGEYGEKINRI